MIAYIKGKIAHRSPTHLVLETAGGVAYHIHISLHTYSELPPSETCKLFIHFQVKEDAHTLYGFVDETERQMFRLLISISGVGPSTAQTLLSAYKVSELEEAILSENARLLKNAKGIGTKTAQRIILELKDKIAKGGIQIQKSSPSQSSDVQTNTNNAQSYRDEALPALLALGFQRAAAQRALNRVLKANKDINSVEQLIREALNVM